MVPTNSNTIHMSDVPQKRERDMFNEKITLKDYDNISIYVRGIIVSINYNMYRLALA